MGRDSKLDVKAMLRRMGYSEKALEEILKWYENSGLWTEKHSERSLCSGNTSRQKHRR